MGPNFVDYNITSSFPLNMKIYFQHKNQTIKLGFKKNKLREKNYCSIFVLANSKTHYKEFMAKKNKWV